jgi:crotonobetainyl-CoA:carnitine CoA-transferase CaiB-like acyl-CoA transferase
MVGLLSAILSARSTGRGCDVDTSLFDCALHQLGYTATWYLNEGHLSVRQYRSAHFSVAPVQTFPSQDGWIFVMCMTDKFWEALVATLDRPDLLADPRFTHQAARQANRWALTETLDSEFRKHPTVHWMKVLAGVLPVAPVYDMEQALENPFLATTKMVNTIAHPARESLRVLANPIRINGERMEQSVCSPMGADTARLVG